MCAWVHDFAWGGWSQPKPSSVTAGWGGASASEEESGRLNPAILETLSCLKIQSANNLPSWSKSSSHVHLPQGSYCFFLFLNMFLLWVVEVLVIFKCLFSGNRVGRYNLFNTVKPSPIFFPTTWLQITLVFLQTHQQFFSYSKKAESPIQIVPLKAKDL